MYSVWRSVLLAALCCVPISMHAQDVPAGTPPPTTAAPGTQASNGAPTISSPAPAPGQPVAFSHKKHVSDIKLACNDCHEPSRNGSTLAIPQPPKCMTCHAAVATEKPDIKRIADAARNSQVLQWVRVYRVPSFVTFSHKTHTTAGAQCEDCHGPVAQRDAIALEKDISMGGCITCHTQKAAPTGCDTCHQINAFRDTPASSQSALLARLSHPGLTGIGSPIHRFFAMLTLPLSAGAPESAYWR